MTLKKDKAIEAKILKEILPDFLNNMLNEGIISTADMSDRNKISEKISNYMSKHNGKLIFDFILDHRETLLNVAENEIKKGNFEFAVSLYATFIEHTLNKIIHLACISKKIDSKTQAEIIRNTNINAKCSWLLVLLNLPPFRKEYVNIILIIADERNSFIHYKWKPEKDTDIPNIEKIEKEEQEKIVKIKSLLRYLKSYETRMEFKGKREKINKYLKKDL